MQPRHQDHFAHQDHRRSADDAVQTELQRIEKVALKMGNVQITAGAFLIEFGRFGWSLQETWNEIKEFGNRNLGAYRTHRELGCANLVRKVIGNFILRGCHRHPILGINSRIFKVLKCMDVIVPHCAFASRRRERGDAGGDAKRVTPNKRHQTLAVVVTRPRSPSYPSGTSRYIAAHASAVRTERLLFYARPFDGAHSIRAPNKLGNRKGITRESYENRKRIIREP